MNQSTSLHVFRLALACSAATLLAHPAAAMQSPTVPTDIQLPGTQPEEAPHFNAPTQCDNCHAGYDPLVEPATIWRGSMMAQASRDPIFWATVAIAEQDFLGSGDLCVRCHVYDGWMAGRSTPTDGSGLLEQDATGVACHQCHKTTNPDDSEHLGVQNPPFVANDGGSSPQGYYGSGMVSILYDDVRLGPYDDAVTPHGWDQSLFHRSADFCGTCHDVSNSAVGDLAPNNGSMTPLQPGTFSGVPGSPVEGKAAFNNFPYAYGVVERTFSEYKASSFPTMRVRDYTSLPEELRAGAIQEAYDSALASNPAGLGDYVDGAPRYYTCQTCHMPPVRGAGCKQNQAPVRDDLPYHDMTGGNYWMPDVIQYLDDRGLLVLGGGVSNDERAALQAGKARALHNLTVAATLEVDGNELEVVNLTGHKLISGYPEGRRMWLRVRWRDGAGALLREDGEYGTLAVDIGGTPTQVETILDLHDPHLRIWEMQPGVSQEWAALLVSLGYPTDMPIAYDRVSGLTSMELGDIAAQMPGTAAETFHFVLNDTILSDTRIPPYGMSYDVALERNALPVPPDQFGAPGPGGTYEHKDEFQLVPPPGAVSAEIDLLYQPTSWEYIQFLYLANSGQSTFLAQEGDHLLDAWLNTGMAAPAVMASTTWTPPDCNENGVPDPVDLLVGTSLDRNGNGVPDECETIGTLYCDPAVPNSTGQPARILALGNEELEHQNLFLAAEQLPPAQFGYFLTSQTQGLFMPPASQGFICLGGSIGRYTGDVGQGPAFSLQVDLTAIPVNPPQAVAPGDTWNFQCWYRDNNPGQTSNFTDAVSVTFQ